MQADWFGSTSHPSSNIIGHSDVVLNVLVEALPHVGEISKQQMQGKAIEFC